MVELVEYIEGDSRRHRAGDRLAIKCGPKGIGRTTEQPGVCFVDLHGWFDGECNA